MTWHNRVRSLLAAAFFAVLAPFAALANNDIVSGYFQAYGLSPTGSCIFCHQTLSGGDPSTLDKQFSQELHARLNAIYGAYPGRTQEETNPSARSNVTNIEAAIRQLDNFISAPFSPRLSQVGGASASTSGASSTTVTPSVGANSIAVTFDPGRSHDTGSSSVSSVSSSSTLTESVSAISGNATTLTITLTETFIRDRSANRSGTFPVTFEPRNASNFRPLASNLTARNTLNISFANLKPIGAAETFSEGNTGRSGADWVLDVLANDDDPDSAVSSGFSVSMPPVLGCVSSVSTGTLTANSGNTSLLYTPPSPLPATPQTVSFQYCPIDGEGLQGDPVTSTISVPALSTADAPTGMPDSFTASEDVTFNGDVSTNDTTTVAGGPLSFSLSVDAVNGSVVMAADGTFTYLSDTDYNGSDSFTYQVSNAAGAKLVSVTMTVQPINDPPVANVSPRVDRIDLIESFIIDLVESTYVTDVDGDVLTVRNLRVDSIIESFRAPAEIVYNSADLFAVAGTDLVVFPEVMKNIDDGDFLEITFAYDVSDSSATASPRITVRIDGVDNDLGRTPGVYADSISQRYNSHFKGFAESGNGACLTCHNPGRVLVDIDFRSDCTPDVFNAYGLTLCRDTSVDVGTPGNLAIRMGNAEAQFAPRLRAPKDQLQISQTATAGDLVGTQLAIDSAGLTIDGKTSEIVSFLISRGANLPPAQTDASGNFVISASGQLSVAQGATLEPGTYPIFVLPVNDAGQKNGAGVIQPGPGFFPVANPQAVTIFVGEVPPEPVADTASVFVDQSVRIDVLANDNGGEATAVKIVSNPTKGSVSVNGDRTLSYTPAPGFIGQDSFTYTSSNGSGPAENNAQVSLFVLAEGALLAVDDTVGAPLERPTRIDLLANDINTIRDGAGATVVTLTSAIDPVTQGTISLDGQSVVFTSVADAVGPITFTYSATNPRVARDTGSPATVTINLVDFTEGVLSAAAINPALKDVARSLEQSCQMVLSVGAMGSDAQQLVDVCVELSLAAADTELMTQAMQALRNEEHLAVVDATATVARSLGRVLGRRLSDIQNGAARGFNTAGINLSIDGETLPTELVTQMARGFLGLDPEGGPPPVWGLFIAGDFSWVKRDGSDTANEYDLESNNLVLGYDVALDDRTSVGVALGYADTLTEFGGGGSMTSEGYQLTAYGQYKDFYTKGLLLDGYASIGLMNFDTERVIAFSTGTSTVDEVATANFDGLYLNLVPRLSYSKVLGDYDDPIGALRTATRVTWSASLDYLVLNVDGYTEAGAGGLSLNVSPETYQSLLVSLGVDASRPVYLGPQITSEIFGGFSLQGELLDKDRTLSAAFAVAGPDAPRFLVTEEGTQGIGAQVQLGTRIRIGTQSQVDANYSYGKQSGGATTQSLGLGYSFQVLGNDNVSVGVTRDFSDLGAGAMSADLKYDLRF